MYRPLQKIYLSYLIFLWTLFVLVLIYCAVGIWTYQAWKFQLSNHHHSRIQKWQMAMQTMNHEYKYTSKLFLFTSPMRNELYVWQKILEEACHPSPSPFDLNDTAPLLSPEHGAGRACERSTGVGLASGQASGSTTAAAVGTSRAGSTHSVYDHLHNNFLHLLGVKRCSKSRKISVLKT